MANMGMLAGEIERKTCVLVLVAVVALTLCFYVCEKELFSDVNLLNLTLPPLATATMMIAAISTSSSRL
jgi:hypothetical protein